MHENQIKTLRAKSYTSIQDIYCYAPLNNLFFNNYNKTYTDAMSAYLTSCGDTKRTNEITKKHESYITCEKYHFLNKDLSYRSVVNSCSTLFYDLDDIAKRQSFQCFMDITKSKSVIKNCQNHEFQGKSNVIVQNCATQIHPIVFHHSTDSNGRQAKKKMPKVSEISNIFLRRNEFEEAFNKNRYYDREIIDRQQEYWQNGNRYRTEFTKPILEEKKSKKKDRGKRTEDPCPCQLFSYACPCTKRKSITELACCKSLPVAEQITSTTKLISDDKKDRKAKSRRKKHKENYNKEDKLMNTSIEEANDYNPNPKKSESHVYDKDLKETELNNLDFNSNKSKSKSVRKTKTIVCPKCMEKVKISVTTSEEEHEDNVKVKSMNQKVEMYSKKQITPTTTYAFSTVSKSVHNKPDDTCKHDPRCEYIPVCQILPDASSYMKKLTPTKASPRIIRITKACRHHPPCTIVPSCQRNAAIKNNCEFIPPCVHQPRCMNLPLCVPVTKVLHYDAVSNQIEPMESLPNYHESMSNNNKFNYSPQIQNACEFVNKYNFQQAPDAYLSNSNSNSINNCSCKISKSCQYDSFDCNNSERDSSSNAVIFIRDVGCQFKNKASHSPVKSKVSSALFKVINPKTEMYSYFTNVQTTYEDKFTSPLMKEFSVTSISGSTTEIDSNCPDCPKYHSTKRENIERGNTISTENNTDNSCRANNVANSHSNSSAGIYDCSQVYTFTTAKSRRNFVNNKYRKFVGLKSRRKARVINGGTKKSVLTLCK